MVLCRYDFLGKLTPWARKVMSMRNKKFSLAFVVAFLVATLTMAFSGGGQKVTICHIPPGNPANRHPITISINAWPAHEAHGDFVIEDESECAPLSTPVPTQAPTGTAVPTQQPTNTPVPTDTPAPTGTPVPTQEPTDTPVPTNTPTQQPTSTPTEAPTQQPTSTPTEAPKQDDPTPTVGVSPAVATLEPVEGDVCELQCCPAPEVNVTTGETVVNVTVDDSPLFTDEQLALILLTVLALGLMNLVRRR